MGIFLAKISPNCQSFIAQERGIFLFLGAYGDFLAKISPNCHSFIAQEKGVFLFLGFYWDFCPKYLLIAVVLDPALHLKERQNVLMFKGKDGEVLQNLPKTFSFVGRKHREKNVPI